MFFPDFDIVTCQLPMSPKFSHGVNYDMCAIPEESGMDFLSIPANDCAAQLTAMDAVSAIVLFFGVFRNYNFKVQFATYNMLTGEVVNL